MTELRLSPGVPVLLAIVCKLRMIRSLRRRKSAPARAKTERGRSSGVEHNLAKVGVGRSNRLARSSFLNEDYRRTIHGYCARPVNATAASLASFAQPSLLV